MSDKLPEEAITWEADISLLTNPLVLKQMALVVLGAGLFMAFLLAVILAATGEFRDIPVMLLISLLTVAGLGVFFCLVALVFFGNRFRVRFTVDNKGALWETVDRRAKFGSRMAIAAGILGRSPQAAGAGILAASREKEFISWKESASAAYNRRRLMITLRNSWRPVMMLVCLPENYDQVAGFINRKVLPVPAVPRAGVKTLGKGLLRTALVTLAAVPLFALSNYPFELNMFLPLLMTLFALATVWLVPLFGWVVLGCAAFLAVQITWIGFTELAYLYGYEQAAFFLAYAGLAYLAWFSRGALQGKIRTVLMED